MESFCSLFSPPVRRIFFPRPPPLILAFYPVSAQLSQRYFFFKLEPPSPKRRTSFRTTTVLSPLPPKSLLRNLYLHWTAFSSHFLPCDYWSSSGIFVSWLLFLASPFYLNISSKISLATIFHKVCFGDSIWLLAASFDSTTSNDQDPPPPNFELRSFFA